MFSENLATGELYYDVAEPTRIIRLPDPRVEFALRGKKTRVLTHKYRTDDAYPTAFQTEDRKIVVEATVVEEARPAAGVTVHFRLIDPEDKAPYASTGAGDNKGGPGSLSVTSATSDADGKVRTVLTVSDTYAGDNYQVEASLQPAPNFKKIARSGVFTAWKRAYVEYDRMYKVGQFINQTSGAGQADPSKVFVPTPATFAMGNMVHVLAGFPAGGTPATADGEMRTVVAIAADHIVVNAPLANTYPYGGGFPPGEDPPYSFVAKVTGGAYDLSPSTPIGATAFDDTFTEWVFVDGGGFVPAWPTINDVADIGRSVFFFKNRQPPSFQVPRTNHVQLVAAGSHSDVAEPNATGATSAAGNISWVFHDKIASLCGGCNTNQLKNFIDSVATHELAHQWNVNPPVTLTDGHDSEFTWINATRECLMNLAGDDTLGVARFHANLAAPSIDLYCIRGHVDDLNQDSCMWP